MKLSLLLAAAAALTVAEGKHCTRSDQTRQLAMMLEQGFSDARTIQQALDPSIKDHFACDCKENEMKAYCNVGAPEHGGFLCCIPKGLSCKTKPTEMDKLPADKVMKKNHFKMCATDHSFCKGNQLILPSGDLKKFPEGLDPVCGEKGTKAFEVAKKLGIPLANCRGSFLDRCECPEGEKKIMRPFVTFKGVAYSQPDCEPISNDSSNNKDDDEASEEDSSDSQPKEEKEVEKDGDEEEDEKVEAKSSLRSNKD